MGRRRLSRLKSLGARRLAVAHRERQSKHLEDGWLSSDGYWESRASGRAAGGWSRVEQCSGWQRALRRPPRSVCGVKDGNPELAREKAARLRIADR